MYNMLTYIQLDEESKNALTALDDKTKIITLRDKNNDEGFLGVCVTTDDVSQYVLRRYFDVQGKGSCACILGFWVDARYANLSNIFTRVRSYNTLTNSVGTHEIVEH
jgi:hypothetical protein